MASASAHREEWTPTQTDPWRRNGRRSSHKPSPTDQRRGDGATRPPRHRSPCKRPQPRIRGGAGRGAPVAGSAPVRTARWQKAQPRLEGPEGCWGHQPDFTPPGRRWPYRCPRITLRRSPMPIGRRTDQHRRSCRRTARWPSRKPASTRKMIEGLHAGPGQPPASCHRTGCHKACGFKAGSTMMASSGCKTGADRGRR